MRDRRAVPGPRAGALPAGARQAPFPALRPGQTQGADPGATCHRHGRDGDHGLGNRRPRGLGRRLVRNLVGHDQHRHDFAGTAPAARRLLGALRGDDPADTRQRFLLYGLRLRLRCGGSHTMRLGRTRRDGSVLPPSGDLPPSEDLPPSRSLASSGDRKTSSAKIAAAVLAEGAARATLRADGAAWRESTYGRPTCRPSLPR